MKVKKMMKKIITLLILLFWFSPFYAQVKFITKTGVTEFEASVPSFEEVKAKNESTTAILNSINGEIAALILVKGFRFKNALMEEHFNENYAESDEFPKATFQGVINNFELSNLKELKSNYTLNGVLTFHGKSKEIVNENIEISLKNNMISLSGNFIVDVSDFEIEIPKVVSNKLSKKVYVTYHYNLKEK